MSNLFSPVVLKFAFLRQVENFYQVVKRSPVQQVNVSFNIQIKTIIDFSLSLLDQNYSIFY